MGYQEKIEWTRKDGKPVTATIEGFVPSSDLDADGWKVSASEPEKPIIDVSIRTAGQPTCDYTRLDSPVELNGQTFRARAGRLVIADEHAALIEAAIAEAKALMAAMAGVEYDDNPNHLSPKIKLDDYAPAKARPGVCPHCGTYCDGDCRA